MTTLLADLRFCLKPRCPVCKQGRLFKPWTITPVDQCTVCGAHLSQHDIGDGAAVFLTFILGFTLIPLAWMFELAFAPPLWVHIVLWGCAGLAVMALLMPALKAYIILLEYRHRPTDMGSKN